MIKATSALVAHIDSQKDLQEFAQKAGLSLSVVYAVKNGKQPSSSTIQKILDVTGFDYEKAFETK